MASAPFESGSWKNEPFQAYAGHNSETSPGWIWALLCGEYLISSRSSLKVRKNSLLSGGMGVLPWSILLNIAQPCIIFIATTRSLAVVDGETVYREKIAGAIWPVSRSHWVWNLVASFAEIESQPSSTTSLSTFPELRKWKPTVRTKHDRTTGRIDYPMDEVGFIHGDEYDHMAFPAKPSIMDLVPLWTALILPRYLVQCKTLFILQPTLHLNGLTRLAEPYSLDSSWKEEAIGMAENY